MKILNAMKKVSEKIDDVEQFITHSKYPDFKVKLKQAILERFDPSCDFVIQSYELCASSAVEINNIFKSTTIIFNNISKSFEKVNSNFQKEMAAIDESGSKTTLEIAAVIDEIVKDISPKDEL